MDIDDQLELEHILFFDRKCRVCGKVKNLMNDFYLTRKDRKVYSSAYSYECKECTKTRILKSREKNKNKEIAKWEYPDW
jgi:predicted SprT family Zn-dependent metalloprotease